MGKDLEVLTLDEANNVALILFDADYAELSEGKKRLVWRQASEIVASRHNRYTHDSPVPDMTERFDTEMHFSVS